MTLFEYISVAISLVLSLTAVRLLSGISVAFREDRRYWVHAMWLVMTLGVSALVWWNFWSFRDSEWDLFRFLLALSAPGSIYLMGAALVPESPISVQSWEEHFYFARQRFFFALASFFITIATAGYVLLDAPLVTAPRMSQAFGLGVALVGAFSPSPRVQRVLPFVFVAMMAVVSVALFATPGSLMLHSR